MHLTNEDICTRDTEPRSRKIDSKTGVNKQSPKQSKSPTIFERLGDLGFFRLLVLTNSRILYR